MRSRLPRSTSSRPEGQALPQGQVDVMADLEDAVACRDARQRDEADHAGDRKRLACEPQRGDLIRSKPAAHRP